MRNDSVFANRYAQDRELGRRYKQAQATGDAAEMEAIRKEGAEFKAGMSRACAAWYGSYKAARDNGAEYMDLPRTWSSEEMAEMIAYARDNGIDAFTIGSGSSEDIQVAFAAKRLGCRLVDVIEEPTQTDRRAKLVLAVD